MYYSCGCYCSCGDDPCGCQQFVCNDCTTTSTTTAIPCIGEKCDELYLCDCIIYNGPDLACYGVFNGDNLCKILQIAASNLPSCAPPVPPTTTTTTCPCLSYTLVNGAKGTFSVKYIPCGDTNEKLEYVSKTPVNICAKRSSVPVKVAGTGTIGDPVCCTSNNPVPSIVSRCTAATPYYSPECKWTNFYPYSFKLISMLLNGVQYVTGTSPLLNINSAADLNIGTGLDGTPYVMNLSDWLNSLVIGSRYTFHDNMRVIDYPYAGATLSIEIEMTNSGTSNNTGGLVTQTYYYNNSQGFSYDGQGTWNAYTCVNKN